MDHGLPLFFWKIKGGGLQPPQPPPPTGSASVKDRKVTTHINWVNYWVSPAISLTHLRDAVSNWQKHAKYSVLICRGDWGWLGQVLVGTVPLSAKRVARLRH